MADSLQLQQYEGVRNVQVKAVDVSDGTGLAAAIIVNASTLAANPGAHWKIRRIRFTVIGMNVRLQWDGVTAADIAYLSPGEDILDFSKSYAGGYPNNATTPNGNIIATTNGQGANSGFTLELELIKGV